MTELTSNLWFIEEHLSPYYLQVKGQVEDMNKSLKTILQWTINYAKSNCHLMFYLVLWVYGTSINTATSFAPFQLAYGLEVVLPIKCQIPSLKLEMELLPETSLLEEHLLYLEHIDELHHDATLSNEAHKQRVKCQYDQSILPWIFSQVNLVLVYDQDKHPMRAGNFKPMCFKPFIVKEVFKKGAYHQVDFDDFEGNYLAEPRNGLYLKKYYS